ncbi:MAG: transposase [Clostridia bacterium]|nr:transposase [Clostridia bacterium]
MEQMVILMYSKGVTTREIAELIEKMYGHYYSRQTISNIIEMQKYDYKYN